MAIKFFGRPGRAGNVDCAVFGDAARFVEAWSYAIVDLSDNLTTIVNGPAIIGNMRVNTALSAHACPIKDGTTEIFAFAASAAVGTISTHMSGTRFATSLVVDPDDAATGVLFVQYLAE